jgi:Subtilase family/FG-GAP-like repeat
MPFWVLRNQVPLVGDLPPEIRDESKHLTIVCGLFYKAKGSRQDHLKFNASCERRAVALKASSLGPFGCILCGLLVPKHKSTQCCGNPKHWVFALASLLILTLLAANSVKAQTSKYGPMAKLTHSLVLLHEQHAGRVAQRSAAPFSSNDPLVTLVDDRVVVDAVASGNVNVLKSDLVSLGMQQVVAFGRVVSGQLPISAIPAAAGLGSLRFAQSAVAMTQVGSVTSQGDQAMGSDIARATFGVNGSGVNVGALSDSFNCLGGAAADTSSDDLPLSVTLIQEISVCTGATDEGRAMLQIVHDVAPGASLAFASAFNGQASFASNIQSLAAAGAKVIVDDVVYLAEPMFQDGIIAQAVDSVVTGGAAYFSAAGNQARQSYQSVFRAGDFFADGAFPSAFGAPSFLGGIAHNFNSTGGTNHFQSITIPGFTTVLFSLQWDSPFFSVSGSPGTENDLDIYLLDASATQVLAGSAFDNVGGDAVELLGVRNNGAAPVTMKLMIVKHSGVDPGLIKYVYFGPAAINDFDTQSSTIFGHANAVGAEAVGAARYSNTPPFSVFPPILEAFSSSGATPSLFDKLGNRLATPDLRSHKPEIVAPDGIDTTFFGSDTDGTGFPNFFGTSAAAPHAAGVAALLLQSKPTLTPFQVYQRMENTAIDMGAPGFDNDSGFGLIQADAALAATQNQPLGDFDGDGKSDVAAYRDGMWLILRSLDGGEMAIGWGGLAQDIVVPADYDGDGKVDIAVYRDGIWYIIRSSDGGTTIGWGGLAQDIVVPGDYDGDGKADIAVYRNGTWFILRSSDGGQTTVGWGGLAQDIPVPADYDGDGKVDIAVYRDGIWYIIRSSDGGMTSTGWGGLAQDIVVPGDYDGDGKADIAVYRNGTWFILRSSDGGQTTVGWGGLAQDIPVPADYDGDGKTDIAIYRNGLWFIVRSSDGVQAVVSGGFN